ncbi:MAG: diacylglycerol kinase family protein [Ferruginibacter sp.]
MQDKVPVKYLFIINPGSGRQSADSWHTVISGYFKEESSFDIYILPEMFDAGKIHTYITERNPGNVIAVGGDGTITMLANMLKGTDIPLGIIPGGSANGMAKELGIPPDPTDALKIITAGFIKSCDLIRINESNCCLHLSDLGLNARLIKYFDEGKLRGKLGYAKVIIRALWHSEKMYVSIRTKDTVVKRIAYMVVLANARMYGTGAVINPEGTPFDGLFEVIIVRRLSFRALLKMLFRPGIFNPKHIEIISCTSAEINTTRKFHFQLDGEYMGKINKVTAVINPGAVKMLLPGTKEEIEIRAYNFLNTSA